MPGRLLEMRTSPTLPCADRSGSMEFDFWGTDPEYTVLVWMDRGESKMGYKSGSANYSRPRQAVLRLAPASSRFRPDSNGGLGRPQKRMFCSCRCIVSESERGHLTNPRTDSDGMESSVGFEAGSSCVRRRQNRGHIPMLSHGTD